MDGGTVYLDRHLPDSITFDHDGHKHTFRPEEFIPYHERFEKAIMDTLHWPYSRAHEAANGFERRHVMAAGIPWDGYQNSLKPYIKADEHESLKKCPPDLDMRPYIEPPVDHKLVAKLEQAMGGQDHKKNKSEVDYSDGHPGSHCGPVAKWPKGDCDNFLAPHSCTQVRGYIQPTKWCKLYEPKK